VSGGGPHSRSDIARRFGVPVSRVRQAERGAIARLRRARGGSECGGGAIPTGAAAIGDLLGAEERGGKAPAGAVLLDERAAGAANRLAGEEDDSILDNHLWMAFFATLLVCGLVLARHARKALRR
jgi:hypothetical protein